MSAREVPVLLVEDDVNDVFLIRRALAKAGITTALRVVGDPVDAILYLKGEGQFTDRARFPLPALVLLDLKLEGGSGFDVLRWVRRMSGIRRLPVIVLTSSSADRDINMAYDLGANSYVVKPLTFPNLVELVRMVEMYWLMLNEAPNLAPSGDPGSAAELPPA